VTEDIQTETQLPPAGQTDTEHPRAAGGSAIQERAAAIANERPEVAAGAAFAGGLLLALILKRIAR
jgi:hypothetical protein